MNDAPKQHDGLTAFAIICREAAKRHGDNWPAIEQDIRRQVDALPNDQRAQLAREMDRVLRYRAPNGNAPVQ